MNTIRASDLQVKDLIILSGGDTATVTEVNKVADGKYKHHIDFSWATEDGHQGRCMCRGGRRIKLLKVDNETHA